MINQDTLDLITIVILSIFGSYLFYMVIDSFLRVRRNQKHLEMIKNLNVTGIDPAPNFIFNVGLLENRDLDHYTKINSKFQHNDIIEIHYKKWQRKFAFFPISLSTLDRDHKKAIIWLSYYYERQVIYKVLGWFSGVQRLQNVFEILKTDSEDVIK